MHLAPGSQARYSRGRATHKPFRYYVRRRPIPETPAMRSVVIRRARPRDSRRLYSWRNDEQARRASASTDPIPWAEHRLWFQRSLQQEDRWLYIATSPVFLGCGPAVGMCRFDLIDPDTAEVSVNLNPRYRGKGLGLRILDAAIARWQSDEPTPRSILAKVRPGNAASVKTFLRAGFSLAENTGEFEIYRLPRDPL